MPAKIGLDLGRIRAAVAKAAKDAKSVRQVADEVGLSYTALRWFIGGGKPHAESRRRLVAWYLRLSDRGSRPTREDLALAIHLLALRISAAATPALKRKRARELVQAIVRELDEDGERALREELRGP